MPLHKQPPIQTICVFLFISILCIACAYLWIDKPVVFWAAAHHTRQYTILIWFTRIPETSAGIFFLAYLILGMRFYLHKNSSHDKVFFALANSFVITLFLKDTLKHIFGRYWADTWVNNNPSLLQNGVYGFNWFHAGTAYSSFPSGHVAGTTAVMVLLALLYPRMRWVSAFFIVGMMLCQAILYYHFVSDILAGAVLGYMVAQGVAAKSFYSSNLPSPKADHHIQE